MDREQVTERIEHMRRLFARERAYSRQVRRQERLQLSLAERVERGIALSDLVVDETDAAVGGRALLWLKPRGAAAFGDLRFHVGEPVRLWARDPEGQDVQSAIVSRVVRGRLGVVVEREYAEFLDEEGFNLDREAPEVTFNRGDQALVELRDARAGSAGALLRTWLFDDDHQPALREPPPLAVDACFDRGLDDTQRAAAAFALGADPLALVHGPPGTGKTRTLVEVVRQALKRGERVLVSAASNTAVDNLAERLLDAGVSVLRLGHPARVSPSVESSTLDARIEKSAERKRAKALMAEAADLRRRVDKRRARGNLDFREGREMQAQARGLMAEARAQLDMAREWILAQSKVVCCTAAGADASLLGALEFDRVVLDEATQAVDPIALAALLRGKRVVLAGDPCQLPPTVLDDAAAREGLGSTFFERLSAKHGQAVTRMLQVQYRMHEQLMRFPSDSMYGGKLVAAASVAARTLDMLPGVDADALRPGPLMFLDTAGKGYAEERSEDDPSTRNPGQAERVCVEVRRLLARGLQPQELAVITPYDAQVRILRDGLREQLALGLEVGTVDGFQGREKEAIVVDLVRCNEDGEVGFLRDERRLNVSLTRAKRFLLVIGDGVTLAHADYVRRFIDAADAAGFARSAWEDDGT